MSRLSQYDFVSRSLKVHDNKYCYDLAKYTTQYVEVTVICPIHGEFNQLPSSHMAGVGCPTCGRERTIKARTGTLVKFINSAVKRHGSKYDYSFVEYKNNRTKVSIVCPYHGKFNQSPDKHYKSGCPACAKSGYDITKPGTLYVLKSNTMHKVGITNASVQERLKRINRKSIEEFHEVFSIKFKDGLVADKVETLLLTHLTKYYTKPTEKFEGYTECFLTEDSELLILNLVGFVNSVYLNLQTKEI